MDAHRDRSAETVRVVHEWIDALNAQHVPGVMSRSSRDIVLTGPRGTTRGQPALREWVERSGLHLTVDRVFVNDDRAIVLHHAVWRDRAGLAIAEAVIVHRFDVADNRVRAVTRFDSLVEALADAGLTGADERLAAAAEPHP